MRAAHYSYTSTQDVTWIAEDIILMRPEDCGLPSRPIEPRSFGPKCKCHNERNMVRVEPMRYACQKSGQIFQLKELLWPS